jgi:hypothetical protein
MLTLKLRNTSTQRTTIVETQRVDVRAVDGGKEIETDNYSKYVVGGDLYDIAYVENSRGSTVQIIKP